MLIYIQNPTPRSEYIFSVLLPALGISDYSFTQDKTLFENRQQPKINYSQNRITENEFWVKPVKLLFENQIKKQEIACFDFNGSKAFFKTDDSDFLFDIFAASFYLVSRYEEYLSHTLDMYGRYAHENSVAFKGDFLKLPLVNLWLQQLKKELLVKFPSLTLHPSPFTFLPTYDIDIAFSVSHKGWKRNAGSLLTLIIDSEWSRAAEKINVLSGSQKDPFDSYEWLDELHKKYQLKPVYFFLLAQQNKEYDKNILPTKKALQNLIRRHAAQYEIGIHPSWQSGDKPELIKKEINILEKIISKKVNKSRQHYIRLTLPDTYRKLIDAGITEDYSMGYGSINGFRSSYCLPYKWYDLEQERVTSLTIYPFCFMDANSYYEQHYSPGEAAKELSYYYQITKQVNGLLITIWHNQFLGTDTMFAGWREVCENQEF